jgi:SAM-dependent methyltransferase
MNNDEYWNKFYSKEFENLPEDPSAFATWISSFKDLSSKEIIDWGAGSGRDSIYFSDICKYVLAVDKSKTAINEIEKLATTRKISNLQTLHQDLSLLEDFELPTRNLPRLHYSRFLLHSLDDNSLNKYIDFISRVIKPQDYVAAEYRVSTSKEISYVWSNHLRWLRKPSEISGIFENHGFQTIFSLESDGLAEFRDENPVVARQIWKIKSSEN